MDLQLNINAEELAKKLTDALTTEAFFKLFKDAVEAELKRLTESNTWNGTNSIMRNTVARFIENEMQKILNDDYKPQIQAAIKSRFQKEDFDKLCAELADKVQIKSNYY
jgi:hypothetical protein